jgi:16S rRNA (guanine966-N2)-methyltransferase
MRVIGGHLAGRKFDPPTGLGIRPTTDRAREALFNILHHSVPLEGIRVLDLFAGSGALAIEFASRGAAQVDAVEKNRRTGEYLSRVLVEFGIQRIVRLHAMFADAFLSLPKPETSPGYDLCFLDPPYALGQKRDLVGRLFAEGFVAPGGQVVLEHPTGERYDSIATFREARPYGSSAFSFFGHLDEGQQPGEAPQPYS